MESGDVVDMYAMCWQDAKMKNIISNVSTSLPGAPSIRQRNYIEEADGTVRTVARELHVQRCKMIEEFFSGFSIIDIHDHLRQGSLSVEKKWLTEHWPHRLYGTIWAMIITDSYLAYLHEFQSLHQGSYKGAKEFRDFIGRLAMQLIQKQGADSEQQSEHQIQITRAAVAAEDEEWAYDDDDFMGRDDDENHLHSAAYDDPEDPTNALHSDDDELEVHREVDREVVVDQGGDGGVEAEGRQRQYMEVFKCSLFS
jgi:hypothetical protein